MKTKEFAEWIFRTFKDIDSCEAEYITELAEKLIENAELYPDATKNFEELKKALLCGASDWEQYSLGGCSLWSNGELIKRLRLHYSMDYDGEYLLKRQANKLRDADFTICHLLYVTKL